MCAELREAAGYGGRGEGAEGDGAAGEGRSGAGGRGDGDAKKLRGGKRAGEASRRFVAAGTRGGGVGAAFPLFERGEDGSLRSTHHPFTAPSGVATVEEIRKSDVTKLLSNSCDLVLNGNEVGGG